MAVLLVLRTAAVPAPPPEVASLFRARAALEDGLAPQAERIARVLYSAGSTPDRERSEALEILLAAISDQGDPARLLETLRPGTTELPKAPTPPAEDRLAFWRARALMSLDRPAEAVSVLQQALPTASPELVPQLSLQLPEALLAAADTNAAVAAYETLNNTSSLPMPAKAQAVLAHATLLMKLSRPDEARRRLSDLLADRNDERGEVLDTARLQLARLRVAAGGDSEARVLLAGPADPATAPGLRALALLELSGIEERAKNVSGAIAAAESAAASAQSPGMKFETQEALARLHHRLNSPDRAIAPMRQALRLRPDAPEAIRLQLDTADSLLLHGLAGEALLEYQTVIGSTTVPAQEARAQRGRGDALVRLGRPAEASVAFLRAMDLAEDPLVREISMFQTGETQRDAALHAQAAETFSRFQTLFPASQLVSRAALLQAESLAKVSPAKAEERFLFVAERYPETPEAPRGLFLAAQLAADRNATAEALAHYEAAIQHPRTDTALRASSHVGRGLVLFHGFHFERALRDFEQASQSTGLAGEQAAYLRTAALYNMGREEEALAASLGILRENPDSPWAPDVTYWLGRYHFNRQQFEEAERYFLKFAESWPTRPECDSALLWVARARFALKHWPEASAAALQLIRDYPASGLLAEARLVHGETLCERMRFDEAILAFDELLALHPQSPWAAQALGRKGDSLFTLGTDDVSRYDESIAAYKALLARPELPLDQQLQAVYKIGRCHEKAGQTELALENYHQGVVLRYAEARDQGIWPNERAKAWFARAALSAADLYEQRGQWRIAVAVLQRMAREDVTGSAEAGDRARRLLQAHPAAARP